MGDSGHKQLRVRRSRVSFLLRWTGVGACLICLISSAASLRWRWVAFCPTATSRIGVDGGDLFANYISGGSEGLPRWRLFSIGDRLPSWAETWEHWGLVRLPVFRSSGTQFRITVISIPMWMPLLLSTTFTCWIWRRDRRSRPGHCQSCRYNLTGNVSGVCPECGEKV